MAKKIKWIYYGSTRDGCRADVGCIVMHCNVHYTTRGTRQFFADVSIRQLPKTFRFGPRRKTAAKAREDAVRMARELLMDHHYALVEEMRNFGLSISDV